MCVNIQKLAFIPLTTDKPVLLSIHCQSLNQCVIARTLLTPRSVNYIHIVQLKETVREAAEKSSILSGRATKRGGGGGGKGGGP